MNTDFLPFFDLPMDLVHSLHHELTLVKQPFGLKKHMTADSS